MGERTAAHGQEDYGRGRKRQARQSVFSLFYREGLLVFSLVRSVGKVLLRWSTLALLKTAANRSSVTRWWFIGHCRLLLQLVAALAFAGGVGVERVPTLFVLWFFENTLDGQEKNHTCTYRVAPCARGGLRKILDV